LVDELSAIEDIFEDIFKMKKETKYQSSATRGMTISCSLKLKREKISQNFGMVYVLVEATLNRPSSII